MPETVSKYRALVEEVAKRTLRGTLAWEIYGAGYIASLGEYSVAIFEYTDDFTDETDYELRLLDGSGDRKDSFKDVDLAEHNPSMKAYDSYFGLMKMIYSQAQRKAIGADEALDSVLASLGISTIEADDELL